MAAHSHTGLSAGRGARADAPETGVGRASRRPAPREVQHESERPSRTLMRAFHVFNNAASACRATEQFYPMANGSADEFLCYGGYGVRTKARREFSMRQFSSSLRTSILDHPFQFHVCGAGIGSDFGHRLKFIDISDETAPSVLALI
ncbi:hypothetical protein EVAR_40926_1 [Eumeta japonica]|uniref:Uncharacterized protein n=1 Tax=Eumeta variegata TaxID=151549 RepID=A0A4C1X7X0_EUMVA|nr:hypothetical protein EVAR_40926_1 [Eumeta japonica]